MKNKFKLLFFLTALICLFAAFAVSANADTVIDAEVVPTGYNSMSVEFTGGATFLTSTQFYLEYDAAVLEYDAYSILSEREGDFASVTKVEDGKLLVNFFAATHAYKNKMLKVTFNVLDNASNSYGFDTEIKNLYVSKDNLGSDSATLTNGSFDWKIPTLTSLDLHCEASGIFYNLGTHTEPDYSSLTIKAVWSNRTTIEVPLSECSFKTNFDGNKSAVYYVEVSYKGMTSMYNIAVGVPEPKSIVVESWPEKVTYVEDSVESFDVTGLAVRAYYDDVNYILEEDEYIIEGFDPSVGPGTQTITVKYYNCEATFDITIAPHIPQRIEITAQPDLLVYKQNSVDEIMLSGIVVKAYYDDGSSKTVDVDDLVATGFDPAKIGEQTITVQYRTKTATFKVEVEPLVIYPTSLKIDSLPIKLSYFLNTEEKLVTTGLKVKGVYDDGTEENLRLNDLEITGFDPTVLGPQNITVSYFGVSATFEITIEKEPDPTEPKSITITQQPTKLQYTRFSDEELDITDMIVVATLGNGEQVTVPNEELEISGFDLTSDEDMQFITLTYKGCSIALVISIIENTELLYGDVDMNGQITTGDARLALRYVVKLENDLTAAQVTVADFDQDGTVTTKDARAILRVSVGLTP